MSNGPHQAPRTASEHVEQVAEQEGMYLRCDSREIAGRAAAEYVMNSRQHLVRSVASSVIAAVIVSGLGGLALSWRTSAVFDTRISSIEKQLDDLNRLRESDALLIANVARDVSYIRGQLEADRKNK